MILVLANVNFFFLLPSFWEKRFRTLTWCELERIKSQHWTKCGPGKSMACISAFHNRLSAFRCLPQCYVSVLPAGGEGAESRKSLTFCGNTSHWFTLTQQNVFFDSKWIYHFRALLNQPNLISKSPVTHLL